MCLYFFSLKHCRLQLCFYISFFKLISLGTFQFKSFSRNVLVFKRWCRHCLLPDWVSAVTTRVGLWAKLEVILSITMPPCCRSTQRKLWSYFLSSFTVFSATYPTNCRADNLPPVHTDTHTHQCMWKMMCVFRRVSMDKAYFLYKAQTLARWN